MAGQVKLRLDLGKLRAEVGPMTQKAVQKAADKTEGRVKNNITSAGLVNSGKLRDSVTNRPVSSHPLYPRHAVGSPVKYVKYPEKGTRAHGPVRAKRLRFKPKGAQGFVFAKWVRGVKAYGFMRKALNELRPKDFE